MIIGAGSVVRHDIPTGTIAVGNPAKPVAQQEAMRGALRDGEGYVP